jgi:hypothetical protein
MSRGPPGLRKSGWEENAVSTLRHRWISLHRQPPYALPPPLAALMRATPTTDLPDVLIYKTAVQPSLQKYFAFPVGQIKFTTRHVPPRSEGRIAIVTDVGRGMRWTRQRRKTSGADADGEVVWS